MRIDFWDLHGIAVAYLDDDHESIYLQDGTPVARLADHTIYTYRGKLLGWLWQGWVFGPDGKCVLFTERAQPGAVRPFRHPPEDRGDKGMRPSFGTRDSLRKRPERLTIWSGTSARNFFQQ